MCAGDSTSSLSESQYPVRLIERSWTWLSDVIGEPKATLNKTKTGQEWAGFNRTRLFLLSSTAHWMSWARRRQPCVPEIRPPHSRRVNIARQRRKLTSPSAGSRPTLYHGEAADFSNVQFGFARHCIALLSLCTRGRVSILLKGIRECRTTVCPKESLTSHAGLLTRPWCEQIWRVSNYHTTRGI